MNSKLTIEQLSVLDFSKIKLSAEQRDFLCDYPIDVITEALGKYTPSSGIRSGNPWVYFLKLVNEKNELYSRQQTIAPTAPIGIEPSIRQQLEDLGLVGKQPPRATGRTSNYSTNSTSRGSKKESDSERNQRLADIRRERENRERADRDAEVSRNLAYNAAKGVVVAVDLQLLDQIMKNARGKLSQDVRTAEQRRMNAVRNQKLNFMGRYSEAYYGTDVLEDYTVY